MFIPPTIDITTLGRRSRRPRRVEIWYVEVDGLVYITGTPRTRDWLANLREHAHFVFHDKNSTLPEDSHQGGDIHAIATEVTERAERVSIFDHPATEWYRDQTTVEDLVDNAPTVRVDLVGAIDESFVVERAPATSLDALVVFAFGNRIGDNGSLSAGPVNEALAATTDGLLDKVDMPVYAQWEVADLMASRSVASITPTVDDDGEPVYLSTVGVAEQALARGRTEAEAAGRVLRRVGVIAFADHATRCISVLRGRGVDALVPAEAELPADYDTGSGQPWTRSADAYRLLDLNAR